MLKHNMYNFHFLWTLSHRITMQFNIWNFFNIWFALILLVVVETKRPSSKRQLSIWQLECQLGMIADPECPVDGSWSSWGPWTPCQGSCDDVGHRHRTRECTNPSPSLEGLPCSGPEEQTELCYLTNCTVNDFRKLTSGDTARLKALHYLENVPALMERCLQMECPFEAIEAALSYDNTWQLNTESVWNALQCVRRNLGCSVSGDWGAWSSWSACGARCGKGIKWRIRKCDAPPPSDISLACKGIPLQSDDCIGDQCAINTYDSGGSWGGWSAWSACSEICGPGVKRRRRICLETNTPHMSNTWGTHCRGQSDQLEICEYSACNLDGGWSGWGGWGPCSKDCGAGKRSRCRSCTRPLPAGSGKACVGPRVEIGSCHLTPCEGFTHTVAVFHGESFLHYEVTNKRIVLNHFYVRFLPLSPHGTLVRRKTGVDSYVRISLIKWHVCLDACGANQCCLPRSCTLSHLDPAMWHSILVSVTNEGAVLRLDDSQSMRSPWPCDPELPDDNINIFVGERFQGLIQEIILNFVPLEMTLNRRLRQADFNPIEASDVAYEKSNIIEAYLRLENENYLRLPCFLNQDEWILELTLKPKTEAGTILFLSDGGKNWLHVDLQNSRLKVKLTLGEFKSESISTTEGSPDNWLDITLTKKLETNAIEASINAGERLHVLFEGDVSRCHHSGYTNNTHNTIQEEMTLKDKKSVEFTLCTDEFFIGGVPYEIKQEYFSEDFVPFSGILASVRLNKELIDLYEYSLERHKDDKIQVSARTASISGSYHETAWGKSQKLNLTCLHARTNKQPRKADWLFLDTTYTAALEKKALRSIDDGKVLKLIATADNDLRGFYTCRAHSNRRTRNIVTYGVLGKVRYTLHGPDKTTAFAVLTTLTLVLGTVIWLFIEGIYDLRNGFGFFRDIHLSPEEEAEAVCKYIDQNIDLIGSKSLAELAKAKARRIGRRLEDSRSDCTDQDARLALMSEDIQLQEQTNRSIKPEILPALPEVRSPRKDTNRDIYRLEPCYISSPRHGSLTSPNTRMASSSSFDLMSPRLLCSKLIMAKEMRSSKEVSLSNKKKMRRPTFQAKPRSNLLTIKSSTFTNQTPGQRILQKFRELKSNDDI